MLLRALVLISCKIYLNVCLGFTWCVSNSSSSLHQWEFSRKFEIPKCCPHSLTRASARVWVGSGVPGVFPSRASTYSIAKDVASELTENGVRVLFFLSLSDMFLKPPGLMRFLWQHTHSCLLCLHFSFGWWYFCLVTLVLTRVWHLWACLVPPSCAPRSPILILKI